MQLNLNLNIKPTIKLKQILAPKIIQMLKVFQMPYAELIDTINKECEQNVFLDIIHYDQLLENKASKAETTNTISTLENTIAQKPQSLYEYLFSQLKLLNLRDKDFDIAKTLLENLDQRGFLENFQEVKKNIKNHYQVQDRKVSEILKILQTLEPDGVCARNLKECLIIQLKAYDFESETLRELFIKIIRNHLDDLANKNDKKIASMLKIEIERLGLIRDFLKNNLNPNPGAAFNNNTINQTITPSFEVTIQNEQIMLTNLEKTLGIQINLSANYQNILKQPGLDEATKTYLETQLTKAQNLVDNIQKRTQTLETLTFYVLNKQPLFIKKGEAYLEPLLQKEIAQNLNLSPSTVSRILSTKFIQTHFGIYPLKSLCPRRHFGTTKHKIKQIIYNLIQENPELSDQKISTLLKNQKFFIARRTVNKYRSALLDRKSKTIS